MNIVIEPIPYESAYDAYRGSSFTPEERAKRDVQEFSDYCTQIIASFEKYDTEDNTNRAELEADITHYLNEYRKRKLSLLYAQSRHVSAFIAGPSNYPTRTMEKRHATIDKRLNELIEYADKTLERLHRKHNPNTFRPIESGDSDALQRLNEELAKAEKHQEFMKACNKIARNKKKTDEEKVAELVALGMSRSNAQKLLVPYLGETGFHGFYLTNNNAKIRRIKGRIVEVTRLQNSAALEVEGKGYTITEDEGDNRLRIEFETKPDSEVISWLKAHSFNWSRYNNAWQRKITANTRRAAQEFVKWFKSH